MSSRTGFTVVALAALIAGLVLSCPSAAQEEAAPSVRTWKAGVDVAVYSEYIWRGLEKYGTAVEPAAYVRFPSFRIKLSGVAETGGDGGMGEVTPSLEYFFSWKDLDFSVGYIFYAHDNAAYSDTSELFATASWNTGTPISPYLEVYWDIDEADALYGRVGVGYVDKVENIDFQLTGSLGAATSGFGQTYFFVKESGMVDFHLYFSMVIPISGQISFEPFAGYSYLIDSSLKTFMEDDSNAYGGAALHVVF